MVEPMHLDSSLRLRTGAHILLDLLQDICGAILSVVGNVLLDSEAPVVALSISMICRLGLSEVLVEIGFRACIRRDKYVCVYMSICISTVLRKKKT